MSLSEDIETFVKDNLPDDMSKWCNSYIGKRKIIHDALWGTFQLEPHEVALLDTPLLQRLRFIHQTGAVYLTYPSAVHTRFEHVIGVCCQANRMCSIFSERNSDNRLDLVDKANIRFAALLHDTGHGPFSHTSEQYFSVLPSIAEIKENNQDYEDSGAGEILSSLMILSPSFKKFIEEINKTFSQRLKCTKLSNIITGNLEDEELFLSEIIHGPFDADKLDYMHRDGLFTGLKMHVDLDRLFASIDIKHCIVNNVPQLRLVGSVSGTSPLMQIMFNKMLLYTGVYHHHKVRAVDCMLWAIFDLAVSEGSKVGGRTLKTPIDFLYLTDDHLLIPELTNNDEIRDIIQCIRHRYIWKRALVISRRTTKPEMHECSGENPQGLFPEFMHLAGNSRNKINKRREIADIIWKRAGKPCKRHEIWLDIPKLPPVDEARQMPISAPGQTEAESLGNFIPIDEWVELYGFHKWNAHVLCPDGIQEKVADATEDILKEMYGLEFNDFARQYARVQLSNS